MSYFLNETRRKKLGNVLASVGMSEEAIKQYTDMPDDMKEVEISMACHVQCVDHFKKKLDNGDKNANLEMMKGVAILMTIVEEANERGYGEDDFPLFVQAMADTINKHNLH